MIEFTLIWNKSILQFSVNLVQFGPRVQTLDQLKHFPYFQKMGLWEHGTLRAWEFGSMGLLEHGPLGEWHFGGMGPLGAWDF
jgi:hypothetical protein